jgi:hypothetical protein
MILCIFGVKLFRKNEDLCIGCSVLGVLTGLVAIVMTTCLCDLSDSRKSHMAEYNNLKAQLEQSNYAPELHEKVLEMNNKIDNNKIYHENIWIGMWYDEELGKCEKIEWKN